MSTFEFEKDLPSTKVTKELIETLEQYMLDRVHSITAVDREELHNRLTITIKDGFGEERFSSIDQFHPARFSDTTRRITMEIAARHRSGGPQVRIRVSLARSRMLANTTINVSATNARENALGLADGISRIVEAHKTWHWIFHPTAPAYGVLLTLIAGSIVVLWNTSDGSKIRFPLSITTIILIVYLVYSGALRPFIVFDSPALDRNDKVWNWLVSGLLAFLLFGVILGYLKKSWLGF